MKIKSLTAKLAALLCACGFAFSAQADYTVTFLMTDNVGKMLIQGLDDNVHHNVFDTWNDGVNNRPNIRIAFTQTVEPGSTATKPTNTPYYDNNITQPNNGDPKVFTNDDVHSYTFDGWATSDGALYDFTTPVTENLTLHPRFSTTGATILINNETELRTFAREIELGRKFREQWGNGQQTVKLANDITLTSNWTPVAGFEGIFDGNSHSISGLVINSTTHDVGFFSGLNSHTVVKDLTFVAPAVYSSASYVGVLAGAASANASTIHPQVSNVNITGAFSVSGQDNVGALIGQVNAGVQIEDCTITGTGATVTAAGSDGRCVGGLLGNTEGAEVSVADCSVSGVTVTGYRKIGGLIGQVQGRLTCTDVSVSNVTLHTNATTDYANTLTMGGLVGIFPSNYSGSTFTGTVSDLTMTGPESIAEGKTYIMGWATGGTGGKLEAAETAMTGANMTFDVAVSGTNTRMVSNDSTYAGINGNPSVTYVAQIGDVKYETLAEAVAATQTGTITVLKDCEGAGIFVGQNDSKNIVIDFDGHTYTCTGPAVGSTGTATQAFHLEKNNTVVLKDGTVTSTAGSGVKMLVQNYSNLTVEGMVLDGTHMQGSGRYVLSNNNGNVVIDGTTINAKEGDFAFDVCRYATYTSVNVEVTGNSEINGNVEVSASGSDAKDGFGLTLTSGTLNGEIVLDDSAKAAMAATTEKVSITKAAEFEVAAPADYKWVDGTTLVAKDYVAQVGNVKYETLAAAIDAAQAGDTVKLLADVDFRSQFANTSARYPISKSLTIDGANHTIQVAGRGFGVGVNATSKVDVTFKDVTIVNALSSGRCVDTRGKLNSITLDGVTLTATNGNSQLLTIGGNQSDAATVTITNSTLNCGNSGYCVVTFNPSLFTATGSTFNGWNTLNIWAANSSAGSSGSVFTFSGCTINSTNIHSGVSNAYMVFDVKDDNIDIRLTNGTVVNLDATGDQYQALYSFNSYATGYENEKLAIDQTCTLNLSDSPNAVTMLNYTLGVNPEIKVQGETLLNQFKADGYFAKTEADEDGWVEVFNGYRVMFVNGEDVISSARYSYNDQVAAPADPVKAEYMFDGWFDNSTEPATQFTAGTKAAKDVTYTAEFTAIPYVAQIGETKYETLAEALIYANYETVTLLANIDLGTEPLVIGNNLNFTLDIGEYNITGTVNGRLIQNNGTLVINGTTGCIYNQDISAQGHDAVCNWGTITVNGGWFGDSNNDKTDGNNVNRGAGLRNLGTGVATINGGHFTAGDNFLNSGWAYAIINGSDADTPAMTINNADVYGKNNGNLANNSGTITVKGGTFDISGTESNYSLYSYSGHTVVEGGTFSKSGNSRSQFCVEVDKDNVNNPGTIAVSGGFFTKQVPEKYCATGCIPTKLANADGYYTVVQGVYVAQVGDEKYATLVEAVASTQEGTIKVLADSEGAGIFVGQSDNKDIVIDFDGHTYTCTGPAVGSTGTATQAFHLEKNNKVVLKGGTVTSTAGSGVKMLVQNYSNLTVEGMVLDGTHMQGSGRYVLSNNNGNVVIDGTTINAKAGDFAFDVCRYATYTSVNVEVKGDSTINGNVEVSASGGDAKDGFGLKLTSGTLNGAIVLDDSAKTAMATTTEKVSITKAAEFEVAAPADYKWVDGTTLVAKDYVAQIGTTKYETLAEAVDAVAANGKETTIKLLMDTTGSGVIVAAGKNIVFDLDGHTYTVVAPTVGSSGTETNAFQLLAGSTVTFKNGRLESEVAKIFLQNYSNLTLDGVVINKNKNAQMQYAVSNNNGSMTATGATEIYGSTGQVAFDICANTFYPDGVSVKFDAGFTGKVEGTIEYGVWGGVPATNKATLGIAAGTFDIAWRVDERLENDAKTNLNVAGGSFNIAVPSDYCALSCTPCELDGGRYSVEIQGAYEVEVPVAVGADTQEAAEAIAEAASTEAIKLPAEVAAELKTVEEVADYKKAFKYEVTEVKEQEVTTGYTVTPVLNPEATVTLTGDTEATPVKAVSTGADMEGEAKIEIKTIPGLYYSVSVSDTVDGDYTPVDESADATMATAKTMKLDVDDIVPEEAGSTKYIKVTTTATSSQTGTQVKSTTTVGVMKTDTPKKLEIVPVPWKGVGEETATVKVSDIIKTSTLDEGAKIHVADGENGYNTWKLQGGKWVALNTTVATQPGQEAEPEAGVDASTISVPQGGAFWVEQETPKPIVMIGEVGETPTKKEVPANTSGLCASPKGVEFDLSTITTAETSDTITVLDDNGKPTNLYYRDGGWKVKRYNVQNRKNEWVDPDEDLLKIKAGAGFWFNNHSGTKRSINW